MTFAIRDCCRECGMWYPKGSDHECAGIAEPEDPWELKGWLDALRGHSCCAYSGTEAARWHQGYQKARRVGLAKRPSFAEMTNGRRGRRAD